MGHEWSPSDVVMVVTAVFGGFVSVISAWRATQAKNIAATISDKQDVVAQKAEIVAAKAEENSQKIDEVHTLTNGNLSKTQEELEICKKHRDFLDRLIIELSADRPAGTLENARKRVEKKQAEIGKRRKSDLKREGDE